MGRTRIFGGKRDPIRSKAQVTWNKQGLSVKLCQNFFLRKIFHQNCHLLWMVSIAYRCKGSATGHARAGGPVSARGGFITALGSDGASQTRVYTYPAGLAPYSAQIAVEAEIAITPASCGRSLQARVHMIRTEAPVGLRGIEVQMPACGTPGGFVLLHDLLPGDPLDFAALNLAGRN